MHVFWFSIRIKWYT